MNISINIPDCRWNDRMWLGWCTRTFSQQTWSLRVILVLVLARTETVTMEQ